MDNLAIQELNDISEILAFNDNLQFELVMDTEEVDKISWLTAMLEEGEARE